MGMVNKIKLYIRNWWVKHIIDYCPPELEDEEFSDKYR
jgi:hypothetical protein